MVSPAARHSSHKKGWLAFGPKDLISTPSDCCRARSQQRTLNSPSVRTKDDGVSLRCCPPCKLELEFQSISCPSARSQARVFLKAFWTRLQGTVAVKNVLLQPTTGYHKTRDTQVIQKRRSLFNASARTQIVVLMRLGFFQNFFRTACGKLSSSNTSAPSPQMYIMRRGIPITRHDRTRSRCKGCSLRRLSLHKDFGVSQLHVTRLHVLQNGWHTNRPPRNFRRPGLNSFGLRSCTVAAKKNDACYLESACTRHVSVSQPRTTRFHALQTSVFCFCCVSYGLHDEGGVTPAGKQNRC